MTAHELLAVLVAPPPTEENAPAAILPAPPPM
jgi:hypothetical protein